MIGAGRIVFPVKKISDTLHLYASGDWHLVNKNCAEDRLDADLATIRDDPAARLILMGDLADWIGPADKRWDAMQLMESLSIRKLADWGQAMEDLVYQKLLPVRDKILGIMTGNHEAVFEARNAVQHHARLCQRLGVPDWQYCALVELCFRKDFKPHSGCRSYRVYLHHGAGAAASAGGKINRLVSFMTLAEADLYLVGHVHEQDVKRMDTIDADTTCTKIVSRKRLGAFTGTYLKTYAPGPASYGERAGYRPVPLGCTRVEIQPFAHAWHHRENSVTVRTSI